MTKLHKVQGAGSRRYSALIKFLTATIQDSSITIEQRLQASHQLDGIYRRLHASGERQKARDFRWRMAQLEHSAKAEAEVEQQADRESSDIFKQAEERQRRLTGRETAGTGTPGHSLKTHGSV